MQCPGVDVPLQGYFVAHSGAVNRAPCPRGRAGAASKQTVCLSCALPFFTEAVGSRQCSSCNAGFYAVFDNVSAGEFRVCAVCPEGADCPAGQNLTVSSLYYAARNATSMALQTFLCDGNRCQSGGTCGPNRPPASENPLCGSCDQGYSEWGGTCVACSGPNGALLLGLLVLAWVSVVAIHAMSQSTEDSGSLRITMYFWQVAFLIVGPSAWVRWAEFLSLNFTTTSGGTGTCPFPISPDGMVVLLLLGPLLTFALLALTVVAHACLALVRPSCSGSDARNEADEQGLELQPPASATGALRAGPVDSPSSALELNPTGDPGTALKNDDAPAQGFSLVPYQRTAIALYFFTFNSVMLQCLSFFGCSSLPDGGSYMVVLPAVRCDTDTHSAEMPLVLVLTAAYGAVVPGLMVYKLVQAHKSGALRDPDTERLWGVIYGALREETPWWTLAQMLFRAAMVAVVVFLRANDGARFGALTLLNVSSSSLLLLRMPNRRSADNMWEFITLAALVLLSASKSMAAPEAWLAVVMLAVGCAISVRTLLQMLRPLHRWRQVLATARKRVSLLGGPVMSPSSERVAVRPSMSSAQPASDLDRTRMDTAAEVRRRTRTLLAPRVASLSCPVSLPGWD
jgi:hypothetical protein